MSRSDPRLVFFITCLAAVAGFIDALGFLHAGGVFVSFMSGNSTRLGVGLAPYSDWHSVLPGLVILLFVIGVVIGTVIGHRAHQRRLPLILGTVTLALIIAASADAAGFALTALLLMAMAMGMENTLFEKDGEVSIGVTYMTGTLVRLGQRIAAIAWGAPRWSWLRYAILWLGLVAGAATGAYIYAAMGLSGLWIAAGASGALTIAASVVNFTRSHG